MEKRYQTQSHIQIEWLIMKSILKNYCGADVAYIVNDLKRFFIEREFVVEGIQRLEKTGIIVFTQYDDYIFSPGASSSPLIRELKKRKPSIPTIQEYELYGWRKLARMI